MSNKKLSKNDLLKAIEQLEKNPSDRGKILGEIGIAGVGAVGAGAVAAIAGASIAPIPVITALTGIGVTVAAPVALVASAAVVGGAAAYGVAKFVSNSAMHETRRKELQDRLKIRLCSLEEEENKTTLTTENKNAFIVFLKNPLAQGLITTEQAQQLIELVELGQVSLEEAYRAPRKMGIDLTMRTMRT